MDFLLIFVNIISILVAGSQAMISKLFTNFSSELTHTFDFHSPELMKMKTNVVYRYLF